GPSAGPSDGGGLPPAFDAPRERPAAPSAVEAAPRASDVPASSAGTDNKYVVWSSAPADVPRTGPDDR
ncbi:MAG: hypothetical protein WA642_07870, partial [Steroidobacteraceae bacterium]